MRSRALLAAAVLLVVPPASHAQTWTYAESTNFEVFTTGGEGRARDALTAFERVHAFFAQLLKIPAGTLPRTRLIVFSGDREFAPYRPTEFTAAFYQPGPDRDSIVMRALDPDSFPLVVHEYVHLLVRHSPGVYPLWLSEGFAEFLSTIEPDGSRMNLGKVPKGRLAYIAENVVLMDLERLFAVVRGSPEYSGSRSHAGVFYSQSWALTHMLYTDERYRQNTSAFVRMVAQEGMASGEALMKAYGKTVDEVDRDLDGYVRKRQFVYFRAPYEAPSSLQAIATRRLDVFEADLVTAHLLSNMRGREADARALFDRLAGERPDDLRLLEARAYFEVRRGGPAALAYLERAIAAGSRAPFLYRASARLAPARAEDLLAKAVQLAPDDVESLLDYGVVLLNGGKAREAVTALLAARSVPLERAFALFHLLATAYTQLNRIDEAKAAADRATQYAAPGTEARQAERLVAAIAEYERTRAETGALTTFLRGDATKGPLTIDPEPVVVDSTGASATRSVSGRMRAVSCRTTTPVVEIATDDRGLVRLAIDDPRAVTVLGRDAGTIDLRCGLHDADVRAVYLPANDAATDTVGHLRVLDYRPQD